MLLSNNKTKVSDKDKEKEILDKLSNLLAEDFLTKKAEGKLPEHEKYEK